MNLSPGLVNSCFELLSLIERRRVSLAQLRSSFAMIGVVQTRAVIECCEGMRWLLTSEDGLASLSPSGQRLMAITLHESRLRQAIRDLIDVDRPIWLQNATYGRRKVLDFVNGGTAQMFLEAGLVEGISDDIVAFWDSLAAQAHGQKDSYLLGIGRQGERLTIAYEERRTGKKPRWISIDSNADGYDVLSVAGPDDLRTLTIEVKATQVGLGAFLHLTRNEWEIAIESRAHVFHLWDISRHQPKLMVLSPSELGIHVPTENGSGRWESVAVPFRAFEIRIQSEPALHSD